MKHQMTLREKQAYYQRKLASRDCSGVHRDIAYAELEKVNRILKRYESPTTR